MMKKMVHTFRGYNTSSLPSYEGPIQPICPLGILTNALTSQQRCNMLQPIHSLPSSWLQYHALLV